MLFTFFVPRFSISKMRAAVLPCCYFLLDYSSHVWSRKTPWWHMRDQEGGDSNLRVQQIARNIGISYTVHDWIVCNSKLLVYRHGKAPILKHTPEMQVAQQALWQAEPWHGHPHCIQCCQDQHLHCHTAHHHMGKPPLNLITLLLDRFIATLHIPRLKTKDEIREQQQEHK